MNLKNISNIYIMKPDKKNSGSSYLWFPRKWQTFAIMCYKYKYCVNDKFMTNGSENTS